MLLHFRKPPCILTPHGSLIFWIPEKEKLYEPAAKIVGRKFDLIIAVSDWERIEMVKRGYYSEKIKVVPNAVANIVFDTPFLNPKSSMRYLLYIGRISREKGQDFAIRGMMKVHNVKLLLIGQIRDQEYYSETVKLAQELGVNDKVFFLGEVSEAKKIELIDQSLGVILTSTEEADGIAIKEAMTRGKPVIVRRSCSLPSLVRNNENGVVVDEPDQIADAVSYISKTNIALEIGNNNKTKAQDWHWAKVGDVILQVYQRPS